jgi:hypothetical protein
VSRVPVWKKAGAVARVAAQQLGRSRLVRAAGRAARTTARSFGRALHQLWLEVTGFTFLAMAAIGGIAGAREYERFQTGRTGPGRVIAAVCFCLVFGYFGVSSFWRVRKRS